MNPASLTTERLQLRAPRMADLDAVHAIHADPETNRFNPAGPHRTIEQSRRLLESWLEHWAGNGFGYWAVEAIAEPGCVIGFGGVVRKSIDGRERLNLYFRFRPSSWGKGFASEMVEAAKGLAFTNLGYGEIAATVRPDNAPSIRVLERLGMRRGGEIPDAAGESLLFVLQASPGSALGP